MCQGIPIMGMVCDIQLFSDFRECYDQLTGNHVHVTQTHQQAPFAHSLWRWVGMEPVIQFLNSPLFFACHLSRQSKHHFNLTSNQRVRYGNSFKSIFEVLQTLRPFVLPHEHISPEVINLSVQGQLACVIAEQGLNPIQDRWDGLEIEVEEEDPSLGQEEFGSLPLDPVR